MIISRPIHKLTKVEIESVIAHIAAKYGLTVRVLRVRCKAKEIAWPRQEAMSALRDLGVPYLKIAKAVGLKDHTTVIYGIASYKKRTNQGIYLSHDPVIHSFYNPVIHSFYVGKLKQPKVPLGVRDALIKLSKKWQRGNNALTDTPTL